MKDKLTPAQECAVELYKSHNTPIKRLRYLDNAAILNESGFPVYDVEIISRYIREAEQRGREEAANGIMEHINEHKDKWYRKDLMTQLTYLEISAIAGEFIALAEAPHD